MTERKTVRVLGCDPGKATGIAVVDLVYSAENEPHVLLGKFQLEVRAAATVPMEGHAKVLRTIIQTYADPHMDFVVANEKYVVTRLTQQSQDTQSLEVSGTLRAILELLEVPHTYCEQLPSSAKLLMTDRTMKDLMKINLARLDDHAKDALRHACTWAVAWVQNKTQITHHVQNQ